MSTIAIYPGTFDPLTNGHADLLRRAARLFDRVVVGVTTNPAKSPFFSVEERIRLAQMALKELDNVSVKSFDGLTVDFAHAQRARVILRGLRAISDFEFEFQQAAMNRNLAADLESLFLTPAEEYTFVSSSLVREVARLGGDISALVSPEVAEAFQRRLNNVK